MSKLTVAHHELARHGRWHLREILSEEGIPADAVEFNAGIEHYHRADRYRQIRVTADNRKVLTRLSDQIDERAKTLTGVTVSHEIGNSCRNKTEKILDISIWPART